MTKILPSFAMGGQIVAIEGKNQNGRLVAERIYLGSALPMEMTPAPEMLAYNHTGAGDMDYLGGEVSRQAGK